MVRTTTIDTATATVAELEDAIAQLRSALNEARQRENGDHLVVGKVTRVGRDPVVRTRTHVFRVRDGLLEYRTLIKGGGFVKASPNWFTPPAGFGDRINSIENRNALLALFLSLHTEKR
jgi:hypothetical protein